MPERLRERARQGRFWAGNVIQRLVTVTTGDPVARGYVATIDRTLARGMQGRSGTIRAGITADPVYRWNGYIDYDQLALTTPLGATGNLRYDPNTALPATAGPIVITTQAATNSVLNQLANQQPGRR